MGMANEWWLPSTGLGYLHTRTQDWGVPYRCAHMPAAIVLHFVHVDQGRCVLVGDGAVTRP
jgi:hypothetical protein